MLASSPRRSSGATESAIPAANDTWVRSVGLSKIIATVCGPARGWRRTAPPSARRGRGPRPVPPGSGRRRAGSGGVVTVTPPSRPRRAAGPDRQERLGVASVSTSGVPAGFGSGVALFTMKPAARAAAATSADRLGEGEADQQTLAPDLRDPWVGREPVAELLPEHGGVSSRPSASIVSMTASAAAQASGLPPKVAP